MVPSPRSRWRLFGLDGGGSLAIEHHSSRGLTCERGVFDHLAFKGGIRYLIEDHRGRAQVRYETPFGGVGNLTTKLDIGPAPWLPPDDRGWVRLPVHAAYDLPPAIPAMPLDDLFQGVRRRFPCHALLVRKIGQPISVHHREVSGVSRWPVREYSRI